MATRLEIAERKLERLRQESEDAWEASVKERKMIPFGQPNIIGRPDIYKTANRLSDKSHRLYEEFKAQEERVRKLKNKAEMAAQGRTPSGGLKLGVYNIEKLEERIRKREEDIANGNIHNYSKRYLNDDKKKLAELIRLRDQAAEKDNSMSDKSRSLIEDGSVNQWAKKPIYYFVKGLRKVALELNDEGEFEISKRYSPQSEEDLEFVEELLRNT